MNEQAEIENEGGGSQQVDPTKKSLRIYGMNKKVEGGSRKSGGM